MALGGGIARAGRHRRMVGGVTRGGEEVSDGRADLRIGLWRM